MDVNEYKEYINTQVRCDICGKRQRLGSMSRLKGLDGKSYACSRCRKFVADASLEEVQDRAHRNNEKQSKWGLYYGKGIERGTGEAGRSGLDAPQDKGKGH